MNCLREKPDSPAGVPKRSRLIWVWLLGSLSLVACQGDHLLASSAQLGEACGNGIDDDGDGQIDEDCPCGSTESQTCYSGQLLSRSRGRCAEGEQACEVPTGGEFGYWGDCAGSVGPLPEACDGTVDDSCDGAVDEGCPCTPSETRPCLGAGLLPPCEPGMQRCGDDGRWSRCLGAVEPEPDRCGDGIDNDCDGVVDRGCGCDPVPEVCGDGVDNDCDGVIDEGACGEGGGAWAFRWSTNLLSAVPAGGGGLWLHFARATSAPSSSLLRIADDGEISSRETFDWVPGLIEPRREGGFYFGGHATTRARVVQIGTDGRSRWGRLLGASLEHHYSVGAVEETADGGVLIGLRQFWGSPEFFVLVRFDSDGNLLWHRRFEEEDQGYSGSIGPVVLREVDDGFLFIGVIGSRGHVVSIDASGEIRWQKQYIEGAQVGPQRQSLVLLEPGRMVLGVAGYVVAFDPRDGTELWAKHHAVLSADETPERGALVRTPRGFAWFADVRDSTYARLLLSELDRDGNVLWAGDFGSDLLHGGWVSSVVPRRSGGFMFAGKIDFSLVQAVGPAGQALGCPLDIAPRELLLVDREFLKEVDEGIFFVTRFVTPDLDLLVNDDPDPVSLTGESGPEGTWLCR